MIKLNPRPIAPTALSLDMVEKTKKFADGKKETAADMIKPVKKEDEKIARKEAAKGKEEKKTGAKEK